jgi:hypothetical protein
MSLSQLEQPVGHGRRADSRDTEAREHCGKVEAAVEAIAKCGQVVG